MDGLLLANLQWCEVDYDQAKKRLLAVDPKDSEGLMRAHREALQAWTFLEKAKFLIGTEAPTRARALLDLMCHSPRFRMTS